MNLENLDNEELLLLSLQAIRENRDSESISLLKHILTREPNHAHATYLLAAQHAQIGMYDRAEQGFRAVVGLAPDFNIARFQLGQLLAMQGSTAEAREILSPLFSGSDALAAYARGIAAVADDVETAVNQIDVGLELTQPIPALEQDMQRLRESLRNSMTSTSAPASGSATPAVPAFLAGYGYRQNGDTE